MRRDRRRRRYYWLASCRGPVERERERDELEWLWLWSIQFVVTVHIGVCMHVRATTTEEAAAGNSSLVVPRWHLSFQMHASRAGPPALPVTWPRYHHTASNSSSTLRHLLRRRRVSLSLSISHSHTTHKPLELSHPSVTVYSVLSHLSLPPSLSSELAS